MHRQARMASGDASVPCSRRIGWWGSLLRGSSHRPMRARFQVSMLEAWPIIVCLFLDEMDKKGVFAHMLKRRQNVVLWPFKEVIRQKVASGRKGKEVLALYHRIA